MRWFASVPVSREARIALSCAAVGWVLLGTLLWIANPRLADAPELDRVSLELPATAPVSESFTNVARRAKNYDKGKASDAVREWRKQHGYWPQQPARVLQLIETLDPPLSEVEDALSSPGCLDDSGIDYEFLWRSVQFIILRELAHALEGEETRAAQHVIGLSERLRRLENECAPDTFATLLLQTGLSALHHAMGQLLTLDKLQGAPTNDLWEALVRIEHRPSPLVAAQRKDAQLARAAVDASMSSSLPYWLCDRSRTERIIDRIYKRRVWLSSRALDDVAWARDSFPEDEYLEKLRERPSWLSIFRFNSLGILVVQSLVVDSMSSSFSWLQMQCVVAARRALWAKDLQMQGRSLPAVALDPAPIDPFTRKAFAFTEDGGAGVCTIPARFKRRPTMNTIQRVEPLSEPPQ